jgi:16S rRNA (cytosine967-C5)-methyltransferase
MTREAAWHVLRSGSPAPLRDVDGVCARRGLEPRDRGLVRAIVGLEIRRRGTLRAIVNAFTRKRPKPELVTHLHIGLVQLLFMDRVPDHAAVSETSDAVSRTVGQSKVPFVHGVLRNVIRARKEGKSGDPRRDLVRRDLHLDREVFRDPVKHPLLWAEDALSMPASLMKRWTRRYRTEPALRLAETFLEEPPLVLRAIGDRAEVLAELVQDGVHGRAGTHDAVIVCPASTTAAVTASTPFREGRLTVQGQTALESALLIEPRPGERLLDLCAAPGGKTAVLAGAGAQVVAVDADPGRLELARGTCERLGVLERVELVESDGTAELGEATYDGVLVDAPCSNTGVLGARPEARWRFGPRSLDSLQKLQARLLAQGAARVRPGGRLVWSTCSLEPEENGRRVAAFLADTPGWTLEEERTALPTHDPGGVAGPWDGGYAARLRREG